MPSGSATESLPDFPIRRSKPVTYALRWIGGVGGAPREFPVGAFERNLKHDVLGGPGGTPGDF